MAHTVTCPTVAATLRHPNRRARDYTSLAAVFTRQGWTPDAMQACEQTFSPATPVADQMRRIVR